MMAKCLLLAATILLSAAAAPALAAEQAQPLAALARMPVKEVTVFKDGHAFLLHEGSMPTNANGNVVMDYLPAPVLGTFFPYCKGKGARLTSVVAGMRRVSVPRTALTVTELIEANPGAEVRIEELSGSGEAQKVVSYDATIGGITTRSAEELEETSPPNSGDQLPQKGAIVLLKTVNGTSAVALDRIQSVTFKSGYKPKVANEEFRNLLSLKLKWDGNPGDKADVGMVYLQQGLRWIPSYKVNLHADGSADVHLQATLINDLTDLQDVTANLVIGVPMFSFKDQTDPMAIQDVATRVATFGRTNTANAFSNAIMSQAPILQGATNGTLGPMMDASVTSEIGGHESPDVSGSGRNEDLFIFTAQHITLKKGQRMVVPIADYDLKYKDVYTLQLPFAPPPEVRPHSHNPQLEKAFRTPKVMHNIRLANKSQHPLTTAPVLLLKEGKLVAQGMSQFTPQNSTCDVTLTQAVDVKVKKSEEELRRTPDAIRMNGDSYTRVDVQGTVELTSFSTKPMEIEVKRFVLGKFDGADQSGKTEMLNVFEDDDLQSEQNNLLPFWWGWYSWPNWWKTMNGMGKTTWNLTIEPHKPTSLHYKWHYFWR